MLKYGVYYQDKNSQTFLFSRFNSKADAEDMARIISHRPYVSKAMVVVEEPKGPPVTGWQVAAVVAILIAAYIGLILLGWGP